MNLCHLRSTSKNQSAAQPASHWTTAAKLGLNCIAFAAGLLLAAPNAWANGNYADIKQALSTGESKRALVLVEKAKALHPKDVQLMFFEGVIKAQTGDTRGAIALFEDMATTYPELPEPHNNLGVLYASKGDLEKAKSAFERAILTNPAYAAAHKNMADVYAALAKNNYGKALGVDAGNVPATAQMTLLGSITSGAKPGDSLIIAAARPAASAPKPDVKPAQPGATDGVKETAKEAPAQVTTEATAATKPKAEPAASTSVASGKAVEKNVMAWANAWAARDMTGYLGAYSAQFDPGQNMSLSAWKQQRSERIEPRSSISIKIDNLSVSIDGKKATALFAQDYRSDTFNGKSNKRFDMVLEGQSWLIVKESVR
jgi:nucleoid-associated protein YgaU